MTEPVNSTEEAERLANRAGRDLTRTPTASVRLAYRRAIEDDLRARTAAAQHEARLSEWPAFVRETFGRLYNEGGMRDLPDGEASEWGTRAHGVLEQQGSWSELRAAAAAHRGIAADASTALSAAVAEAMAVDKLEETEASMDPRDAADLADAVIGDGPGAFSGEGSVPAGSVLAPDVREALQRNAAKAKGRRDALLANLAQSARSGALGRAVSTIAKDAAEQSRTVSTLRGCGLGAGGGDPDGDIPVELVRSLSADPRMREILTMLGRIRDAAARGKLATAPTAGGEITGVTTGGNPQKLIGAELAMLAGPTGVDVVRRLAEHAASVWDTKGEERKDRGDVVFIVDRSGSMEELGRHAFARALVIAAVSALYAQGRTSAVVMFGGVGDVHTAVVRPRAPLGLRKAIELATLPPRGGTHVPTALKAAGEVGCYLKNPDVLLITDACFPAPPRADVRSAVGKDGRLFVLGLGEGARLAMPDADVVWALPGAPQLDDAVAVMKALTEVRRTRH